MSRAAPAIPPGDPTDVFATVVTTPTTAVAATGGRCYHAMRYDPTTPRLRSIEVTWQPLHKKLHLESRGRLAARRCEKSCSTCQMA